jgi:hypothetical protein
MFEKHAISFEAIFCKMEAKREFYFAFRLTVTANESLELVKCLCREREINTYT